MWHLPVDGAPDGRTYKCTHSYTISGPDCKSNCTDSNANRLAYSDPNICADRTALFFSNHGSDGHAHGNTDGITKRYANKAAIGGALCITKLTANLFANSTALRFSHTVADTFPCDTSHVTHSIADRFADRVTYDRTYVGDVSGRVGSGRAMHRHRLHARHREVELPRHVRDLLRVQRCLGRCVL